MPRSPLQIYLAASVFMVGQGTRFITCQQQYTAGDVTQDTSFMSCLSLCPLFLCHSYVCLVVSFRPFLIPPSIFVLIFFYFPSRFLCPLSFILVCAFSAVSLGWYRLVLSRTVHTVHTSMCAAGFQHTTVSCYRMLHTRPSDFSSSELNPLLFYRPQMTHCTIHRRPSSTQAITVTLLLLSSEEHSNILCPSSTHNQSVSPMTDRTFHLLASY